LRAAAGVVFWPATLLRLAREALPGSWFSAWYGGVALFEDFLTGDPGGRRHRTTHHRPRGSDTARRWTSIAVYPCPDV